MSLVQWFALTGLILAAPHIPQSIGIRAAIMLLGAAALLRAAQLITGAP